jgi:hypothetical protein
LGMNERKVEQEKAKQIKIWHNGRGR